MKAAAPAANNKKNPMIIAKIPKPIPAITGKLRNQSTMLLSILLSLLLKYFSYPPNSSLLFYHVYLKKASIIPKRKEKSAGIPAL